MGIFDINLPTQQAPSIAASLPQLPQIDQTQPQPVATSQPTYVGLKRPPPAIGTVVNGYTYLGGDPRSQDTKVWKPASGEAYLNSLPVDNDKKTLIKAIANYELPPGSGRGGLPASPEVQQMLSAAKQYNPQFDAKNYSAIQKTKLEVANPDSRFNLTKTALNTAIGHALGLAESAAALHNHQSPMLNAAGNWVEQHVMGDPRQGNFNQNAELLSGEVVKAITGSQGGGQGDREKQLENYPVNGSPDQQNQAIGKTVDLLKSKLDEMSNTLRKAGNPNANALDVLSPTARDAWAKLSKQYGAGGTSSMGNNGASSKPGLVSAPQGVDANIWAHMTPQERKLWQN